MNLNTVPGGVTDQDPILVQQFTSRSVSWPWSLQFCLSSFCLHHSVSLSLLFSTICCSGANGAQGLWASGGFRSGLRIAIPWLFIMALGGAHLGPGLFPQSCIAPDWWSTQASSLSRIGLVVIEGSVLNFQVSLVLGLLTPGVHSQAGFFKSLACSLFWEPSEPTWCQTIGHLRIAFFQKMLDY